jgi:hypothetical protein
MSVGLSPNTSTIDEELYGSHSNESEEDNDKTTQGKTTIGAESHEVKDDGDAETKDTDYLDGNFDRKDELIAFPHRDDGSPSLPAIPDGPPQRKGFSLFSEGPNHVSDELKERAKLPAQSVLRLKNKSSLTVPNLAMGDVKQRAGKHRKLYSEGPKGSNVKHAMSPVTPSETEDSRISDLFDVTHGDHQTHAKLTRMPTIKDDEFEM